MGDGPEQRAPGPRSVRDSVAPAELDLHLHDWRSLIEQLPLAVYIDRLDESSSNVYTSPQLEAILGYTAEEWAGDDRFLLKVLHPEDRERVMAAHRRSCETGEPFGMEYRLVARDGRVVWFLDRATVVPGQSGKPAFHHGFYLDISERKELERALEASTEELRRQKGYFESLLDISPVAIVTTDLEDVVTSWNPAAERLFGYSQSEALGRRIDDLVAGSPELRAEAASVTRQVLRDTRVQAITQRAHKDGSLIDVELLAAPVVVGDELVGTYAIYHDVSELLRARRAAEAATEAKSAFLATMSHEIRTPLNAVIGMTELLLATELTPEQRELADVVRTSGDALLGVINEILDFSKIEAGRLQLEHRPFVLRDCVDTALELVAATATAKGLEVACLVDPQAPTAILGDPARLRQILVNLLANAVKFTERGEVVLTVQSEAAAEAGDVHRLHFTVRDTGIGIPADEVDRLFESFSQLDASTTRRHGGTGLGLAISKRLCEMMGGRMWAHSEPSVGSAFHFTLSVQASSGTVLPPHAPELRGKRLLVVDDNAANREVIMRHARAWGMVPRETGSPTLALEWIRRGDPLDVATLDMRMPEMDGLTLAREIRRHRDAHALPLVMLTSLGRRTDDRGASAAFAAFLTKPIRASQLYAAVAAAVGARTAGAPDTRDYAPRSMARTPAPLRILLVEDNAVNRQVALLLLDRLGHRADVARNGLEALETLRQRPYEVVLMDVEMPEMDGPEAARRIHRLWPGSERPRIIAMTANAMQGDREMCLAAGMDDYLSKPIRPDELSAALSRCNAAPASSDQDRVLDPQALQRLGLGAGDRAFVAELVDTFLHDAPVLLDELRGALAAAELQQLRRAAHTLKSNGRVFGATTLARLCQELEAMASAERLADAVDLAGRIEGEYARVERALREVA